MHGRITSTEAPALNEYGVPYLRLWEMERQFGETLAERYRQVIRAWLDADNAPPNSRQRAHSLSKARLLTQSVLQ